MNIEIAPKTAMTRGGLFNCAALIFIALSAPAAEAAAGNDAAPEYTLFDPVPDGELRTFSPDRPGKAHAAQTLDAGHFDIESDFVNYTYSRTNGMETRSYSVATPLLKMGVTDWADIEFATQLYSVVNQSGPTGTPPTRASGFGDVSFGSKINFFGNDGGNALSLLSFVKLPTAAAGLGNGVVEANFNLPFNTDLGGDWTATLEPGLGILQNSQNTGYHAEYSFSAVVSHPVFIKTLLLAIEVYGERSGDRHIPAQFSFDPSLAWLVTPFLQLDAGIYLGLNRASADYNPYVGISVRY